jgi:hypothetical protein
MSAVITFPDNFPWQDLQYYAGQFGVQDTFDSSEASSYGNGPYYLSKYPDPSSIVV